MAQAAGKRPGRAIRANKGVRSTVGNIQRCCRFWKRSEHDSGKTLRLLENLREVSGAEEMVARARHRASACGCYFCVALANGAEIHRQ